jgi:CRP/FNR family transcriptional regulator
MLNAASFAPTAPLPPANSACVPVAARIAESLEMLKATPIQRRIVHPGDRVYQAGERFANLHVVHSGFFKTVNLSPDGREQVVALHFKGDWLGFDGIAEQRHSCDAVALDTGELWSIRYDTLLGHCAEQPALLAQLHAAMSREIGRDRDSMMSLCTLSADARVAEFLRYWAESQSERGLRSDDITLRMTRAEIGNYLGMTLESVSRALTRLAREHIIRFAEAGRRHVQIPDAGALLEFVRGSMTPAPRVLQ